MSQRLAGKTVFLTHADRYMGPAIRTRFEAEGARVQISTDRPQSAEAGEALLSDVEGLDVLVANLAFPPQPALVDAIDDADWHALFDHLVHPLMGLVRGAAKRMKAAGGGRIIAVTSAAPLRGIPKNGAYCAARGAQNAFLRAAGLELARDHISVAAIAQNYIENDTYYPPELLKDERFLSRMREVVPAQHIGDPKATADLALFLATEAQFMPGQIFPLAGGWTTTL
jgi:2-keto-3-deoxy-L-fuconate dehydrogenase